MKIKSHKVKVDMEREIAMAMVVSSPFIKELLKIYNPNLIKSKYVKTLNKWCIDYYNEYKEAPDRTIEEIYFNEREKLEEAISDNIQVFLTSISKEYGRKNRFNYKYVLTNAEIYLRGRHLEEHELKVGELRKNKQIEEAERLTSKFKPLALESDDSFDLFDDTEGQAKMFLPEDEGSIIFRFPPPLDKYFPEGKRGQLGSFWGPGKRGKSFNASFCSRLAVLNGFNVGEFNFEMTKYEQGERHTMALSGRPGKKKDEGFKMPYIDCHKNIYGGCHLKGRKSSSNLANGAGSIDIDNIPVGYVPCTVCRDHPKMLNNFQPDVAFKKSNAKVLTPDDSKKILKKFKSRLRGGRLKIKQWPSDSKTILDIENQLDKWEDAGFIVDMIVIDYTELMNAVNMNQEVRHRINDNWAAMKRLAQERNIFVLALSQTVAETHKKRIERDSSKESKSKGDHVDWTIALNQSVSEEMKNIISWQKLFDRHGTLYSYIDFKVLTQFAISQAFIDAYLVINDPDE